MCWRLKFAVMFICYVVAVSPVFAQDHNAPASTTIKTISQPNNVAIVPQSETDSVQQISISRNYVVNDEAVRIARMEMERDAYKQAVDAYRQSIENFKWAGGLVLTAIGIILVLFGYAAYRETKKYEEATEKAEKAAEDARKCEQDAKGILEGVSKQAATTLDNIKEEGKKQIRELIAEAGAEQKSSELWNEALRLYSKGSYDDVCAKCDEIVNRKPDNYLAYHLWGNSLIELGRVKEDEKLFEEACSKYEQAIKFKPDMYEAYLGWGVAFLELGEVKEDEKLFEEACRKYEQAIKLKPDMSVSYTYYGNALIELGRVKEDEKLFEEACRKYEQAIKLKPDAFNAYHGWGITLIELGRAKDDEKLFEEACRKFEQTIKFNPDKHDKDKNYETYVCWGLALCELGRAKEDEKLFEEACRKFEQAVTIKPNESRPYSFWGGTIVSWAILKTGTPEYDAMLRQAEEICFKAEALKKGSAAYDLACISVLKGDRAGCKKWLELGQETRTLLRRNRALKTFDWASFCNEDWFKKLKWKYEK